MNVTSNSLLTLSVPLLKGPTVCAATILLPYFEQLMAMLDVTWIWKRCEPKININVKIQSIVERGGRKSLVMLSSND